MCECAPLGQRDTQLDEDSHRGCLPRLGTSFARAKCRRKQYGSRVRLVVAWTQTHLSLLRQDTPEQVAHRAHTAALAREERAIINVRAAEQSAVLAAWLTQTHLR